jgi:hypothetical protein
MGSEPGKVAVVIAMEDQDSACLNVGLTQASFAGDFPGLGVLSAVGVLHLASAGQGLLAHFASQESELGVSGNRYEALTLCQRTRALGPLAQAGIG